MDLALKTKNKPIRPVVYALCLYFMLSGADSFQVGKIGSILKIIALIPLAMALLDSKNFRIRCSAVIVFQLLFWVLALISLLYSVKIVNTISFIKTLTLNLVLVFVLGMMEQYTERELQYLQRALLMGGWITIGLLILFSDVSAGGRLTLLLGSQTQDQNYINGYFLFTFSWHCARLLQDKKNVHVIAVIFMFAIVLLTGSRGALLAFSIVLFAHMCFNFVHTNHLVRNVALAFVLFAVMFAALELVLAYMPENVSQRFSWDYIEEKGTTGRTRIWGFLLQHFSEDSIFRMLFGHGYGTTVIVNTAYNGVAHNLYLDILITLGILGVLLHLATQCAIIRSLFKSRQFVLLCAFFGMICMCLSLSLVSYKPIWNILILTLAIDFHKESDTNVSALSESKSQEVST